MWSTTVPSAAKRWRADMMLGTQWARDPTTGFAGGPACLGRSMVEAGQAPRACLNSQRSQSTIAARTTLPRKTASLS